MNLWESHKLNTCANPPQYPLLLSRQWHCHHLLLSLLCLSLGLSSSGCREGDTISKQVQLGWFRQDETPARSNGYGVWKREHIFLHPSHWLNNLLCLLSPSLPPASLMKILHLLSYIGDWEPHKATSRCPTAAPSSSLPSFNASTTPHSVSNPSWKQVKQAQAQFEMKVRTQESKLELAQD